jgi:hypothetical protein
VEIVERADANSGALINVSVRVTSGVS